MGQSLGEALPEAIAKVSEWIGHQEAQAKEYEELLPGMGDGTSHDVEDCSGEARCCFGSSAERRRDRDDGRVSGVEAVLGLGDG